MPGGVERAPNDTDLAVHHAARTDHVDAGLRVGDAHLGVQVEGGVVVDATPRVKHPAVAVIGELIEAEVGHHDQRIADLGDRIGDRDVEDATGVERPRSGRILALGQAEEHHPAEPELGRLGDRPPGGVARVLHDPGHALDRRWFAASLGDEHRQHQVARLDRRLRDQVSYGR